MISKVAELFRTNKKIRNLEEFVVKLQKRISDEIRLHTLSRQAKKML